MGPENNKTHRSDLNMSAPQFGGDQHVSDTFCEESASALRAYVMCICIIILAVRFVLVGVFNI